MRRRFADAGGALRILVAEPFGRVLLVVVAVGLLGFAAWQTVAAALDVGRRGARLNGIAARVGFGVSAIVHAVLGIDALRLAVSDHAGRPGAARGRPGLRAVAAGGGGGGAGGLRRAADPQRRLPPVPDGLTRSPRSR